MTREDTFTRRPMSRDEFLQGSRAGTRAGGDAYGSRPPTRDLMYASSRAQTRLEMADQQQLKPKSTAAAREARRKNFRGEGRGVMTQFVGDTCCLFFLLLVIDFKHTYS